MAKIRRDVLLSIIVLCMLFLMTHLVKSDIALKRDRAKRRLPDKLLGNNYLPQVISEEDENIGVKRSDNSEMMKLIKIRDTPDKSAAKRNTTQEFFSKLETSKQVNKNHEIISPAVDIFEEYNEDYGIVNEKEESENLGRFIRHLTSLRRIRRLKEKVSLGSSKATSKSDGTKQTKATSQSGVTGGTEETSSSGDEGDSEETSESGEGGDSEATTESGEDGDSEATSESGEDGDSEATSESGEEGDSEETSESEDDGDSESTTEMDETDDVESSSQSKKTKGTKSTSQSDQEEDTESSDQTDGEDKDSSDEPEDELNEESSDEPDEEEDTESSDQTDEEEDTETSDQTDEEEDTESSDQTEDGEDEESSDQTEDGEDEESSDQPEEETDTESSDEPEEEEDTESSDQTEPTVIEIRRLTPNVSPPQLDVRQGRIYEDIETSGETYDMESSLIFDPNKVRFIRKSLRDLHHDENGSDYPEETEKNKDAIAFRAGMPVRGAGSIEEEVDKVPSMIENPNIARSDDKVNDKNAPLILDKDIADAVRLEENSSEYLRYRKHEARSPGSPRRPAIAHMRRKDIALTWSPPDPAVGPPAEGYFVEMKDEDGNYEVIGKPATPYFEIKKLQPGKTYLFKIKSRNEHGASPPLIIKYFMDDEIPPESDEYDDDEDADISGDILKTSRSISRTQSEI